MTDICNILICSFMFSPMVSAIKDAIHFNKYIRNSENDDTSFYTFEWLLKVSLKQCVNACKTTKACEYINFENRYHRCGLVRSKQTEDAVPVAELLEIKPGSIFGKKSEWNQDNFKDCDSCQSKGNCGDTTGNKGNVCRNSGCEMPVNSDVKGNMLSTGSHIIQNCKSGYSELPIRTSHWTNQSVCLANGTWTPNRVCLKGQVQVQNESYYYIQTNLLSWYDAKLFCESLSGHLVAIEDETEQKLVESLLVDELDDETWCGMSTLVTTGIYQWLDGTAPNYTHWVPTQPNNPSGKCIKIMHSRWNYGWATSWCSSKRQSICEFQ